MQWPALLPPQPTTLLLELRASNFGFSQNSTISEALLAKYGMDGSQYGAMGVLPHPFHIPMRLEKLWVAMDSLASASANRFIAGAPGLKFGGSKNDHDHLRGASGQV